MTALGRGILAGVVVAALGAGGWFFLTGKPVAVPVVRAVDAVDVRVYGLGTVEARIVSRIGFEVGAALGDLSVDSGDTVTRGQILAQLHPAEQQARVARAQAAVQAAAASAARARATETRARAVFAQREAAYLRQQALVVRSTISTQALEEAQRDVAVAAADLALAGADIDVAEAMRTDAQAALQYETTLLDHHTLRAPFDAVVVDRHVEVGTVVGAGEAIYTLMDPGTVWTLAYVDEARAGSVALGQPVDIRLRSLPHDVFTGTVARIGIESDRVNEERRVWIACDQCPHQVFLGEQAEVRITVANLTDALLVPEVAVTGFDGHQGRVWVVQEGRLTQVELIFGLRTEDALLEVVSGLPDGAQIVAAPAKGLAEGRLARVEGGTP